METVNTATTPTPYYPNEQQVQRTVQASQAQLAAVSSSRSLDLELTTKEGDKVTLSIDSKASALYAAFGDVQVDGDDSISANWGELRVGQYERDVTLTVEGHLNRAERREIRKVLRTINKMMNNFVEGKLKPMMAGAAGLQGLRTIEGLEVDMSYERQVVVAQQRQTAISYTRTGQLDQAPAALPESTALPLKTEAEDLAENMADTVATAQAPTDPLRAMADELLKAYRERASHRHPMEGRVLDHIRELFNAAMDNR